MKHVASQSGIPVQVMQTFAPLLSQRSALPSRFAEIPMQGASDSPQRKLLTWWHGCYFSTITEASERKPDTSSIKKTTMYVVPLAGPPQIAVGPES